MLALEYLSLKDKRQSIERFTAKHFVDMDSTLYAVTILKGQYEARFYEGDDFQQASMIDLETEFAKCNVLGILGYVYFFKTRR